MNQRDALRDEWEDRLAEQSLGELLGGKSPPDLSERILAAAQSAPVRRRPRIGLALAASIVIAMTLGGTYVFVRLHAAARQVASSDVAKSDMRFEESDKAFERVVSSVQGLNTAPQSPSRLAPPSHSSQPRANSPPARFGDIEVTNGSNSVHEPVERMSGADVATTPAGGNKAHSLLDPKGLRRLRATRKRLDVTRDLEPGGLPTVADPRYPDPEEWQRVAQRRKKYRIVDQEQDGESGEAKEKYFLGVPYPEEADRAEETDQYTISISSSDQNPTVPLDERLKTRVQVNLRNDVTPIPLRTALALIGREVGLEFRIEPEQLANVPVMPPELSGRVSVKGALATILQARGFNVSFEAGQIRVTDKNSPDEGRGPGEGGDRYSRIVENPFLAAAENPLSTFSIDVDTASFAKVRRYLLEENSLPPPDAVRIEELINYFSYELPQPDGEAPFAARLEAAACPWQPRHRLLRISLKAREIPAEARPAANLVFLLDVSGSMQSDDKLPRVIRSMRLLTEQLREQDRVAVVTYAGSSGLALPSTSGFQKQKILSTLDSLSAGGSTNGSEGIALAYATAAANFIKGGTNRVILCTDGDFNVGTTSDGDLERLIEEKAKSGVFLTVLGFGMGNHNDQMLEKLADKGNGNYGYVDSEDEARKLLVEQAGGTLLTVAKDVKLQLEFNPRQVAAYRLIGYEDRLLRAEDFNDDRKDAGEIGAGHAVTALYELIPTDDKQLEAAEPEPLKYQRPAGLTPVADADELATLKVKYKEPAGQTSQAALAFVARDAKQEFAKASPDFKFAAAVAAFGMLLRNSEYRGGFTYDAVLEIAQEGLGADAGEYRRAFLEMVRKAKGLAALKRP